MSNSKNIGDRTIDRINDLWLRAKIWALRINVSFRKGNDPTFYKKSITIGEYASFLLGGTQPNHPLKVFIEVSNLCNIKCVMCNTFSVLNELKTESLKTIDRGLVDIDTLKKQSSFMAHALWVPLMGYGESTMHKQFSSMLEYLGESGLRINFFTNGTNFTDELVQAIVNSKVADVTISLSGNSKEQFETVYHGADFDKVLAGIKKLQEYKNKVNSKFPELSINSIAFQDHVLNFDKFVELMADHGVSVINLSPLYTYGFEAGSGINLRDYAADSENPRFVEVIRKAKEIAKQRDVEIRDTFSLASAQPKSATVITGMPIKSLSEKLKKELSNTKPTTRISPVAKGGGAFKLTTTIEEVKKTLEIPDVPNRKGFICGEPFSTFYIDINGQVKTCCNMPTSRYEGDNIKMLGDIAVNSAEEIWGGLPYKIFRENVLKGIYPVAACGSCLKNNSAPPSSIVDIIHLYLSWYVKAHPENEKYALSVRNLFNASMEVFSKNKHRPR